MIPLFRLFFVPPFRSFIACRKQYNDRIKLKSEKKKRRKIKKRGKKEKYRRVFHEECILSAASKRPITMYLLLNKLRYIVRLYYVTRNIIPLYRIYTKYISCVYTLQKKKKTNIPQPYVYISHVYVYIYMVHSPPFPHSSKTSITRYIVFNSSKLYSIILP